METNLFNLWTYFIIYSICGWILESVYRSFREKKIINTGFLNGPMCPIYGIGAIIMILFLGKFSKNIIVLFLVSFIVLSIWEYIVGVYLEKTFKTKYWDYSDHKINIKGRVCLSNSICWGILGVLFIKYISFYQARNIFNKSKRFKSYCFNHNFDICYRYNYEYSKNKEYKRNITKSRRIK